MKKILLILMLLSLTNCSSNQTKSHMSSVIGEQAMQVTVHVNICYKQCCIDGSACTVVNAWVGASLFYNDDMNIHKVTVFVDTLNTSLSKRSHVT